MDQMVLAVQNWINLQYSLRPGFGGGIKADGKTGWTTMFALTRALQIELGIENPVDSFGPETYRRCPTLKEGDDHIIVKILQGAMWCKGYNPGGFTTTFGPGTKAGVKQMQSDAGVTSNGIVTPDIFKAMLRMDAYKLVNNGDPKVRRIQRDLNGKYYRQTGIQPADGHYSRDTNKAMIFGLQVEGNVAGANGHYGPGTRAATPTLRQGDSRKNFVQLVQYAMYVNKYDPGNFNGVFDSTMVNRLKGFQAFYTLPPNGIADLNTWMALLVSTGNPDVKGTGADTSETITPAKADTLVADGREIVGRYLTGSFALSSSELTTLYRKGLRVFPILQRYGHLAEWFSYNSGVEDAREAVLAATTLKFPYGTTIYFAVDYDASDFHIFDRIVPYFEGVRDEIGRFRGLGASYKIGIYGPRYVCTVMSEKGLTQYSFVSGMSTGFYGNKGQRLPGNWTFNQVKEHSIGTGAGKLDIDNNIVSGRDMGADKKDYSVSTPDPGDYVEKNAPFFDELKKLYDFAVSYGNGNPNDYVLHYLRHEKYNGSLWNIVAGPLDDGFINAAKDRFGLPSTDFPSLYDPITGVDMDVIHMAATLNGITNQDYWGDPLSLSDYAGWIGDLITVIGDSLRGYENGKFDSVYAAAKEYIGHVSSSASTFSLEDLLGDFDALVFGRTLKLAGDNANIYEEWKAYYRVGYRRRFKAAMKARFNYQRQELYDESMKYLTGVIHWGQTTLFKEAFDVPDWTEDQADEVARAFRDIVSEWLDKEEWA